jgi:nucleoside diphosphate kinase
MAAGREELTFIMVKPDGVHRGLISDIIKRFEQKGYKLVGIKILVPNRVRLAAGCWYASDMHGQDGVQSCHDRWYSSGWWIPPST